MPQPEGVGRRLVLVTGSTRSGTSLAAGTLHHLGLLVPAPHLKANPSNPAGFFESVWPVRFHRRLMEGAGIGIVDARPEAFDLAAAAVGAAEREELARWLAGVFEAGDQVVVKDPRAVWVPAAWERAAEELPARIGTLIMLRHPAEVVASRSTYYGSGLVGQSAWRYRVLNLCAWININTGLELRTRGRRRVVVRYEDLVGDWRSVASRVGDAFGLELHVEADASGAHPVDAFVDPGLRRHEATWAGSDMPEPLIEIAEGVWSVMVELTAGASATAADQLDTLREAYARQLRIAAAMTSDVVVAAVRADRTARPGGVTEPAGRAGAGAASMAHVGRFRRAVRRLVPLRIRRIARRTRG